MTPTIIAIDQEHDPDQDYLPADTVWCVYRYESLSAYEGEGEAYCMTADGTFYEKSLGHCSCYDAWDRQPGKWSRITLSELFDMHIVGDSERAVKFRAAIEPLLTKQNR